MAERKLERSLQLTGLDIQRASEIWKKLSNEGLEYLSQLGNRTLTAYQQLSTTDFEVSLSKLEAQSNMPPLESLTEQKVQDLLARMRIQLNIMQLAVSKMDTAIQHARPWLSAALPKTPVSKPSTTPVPIGASSINSTLTTMDILQDSIRDKCHIVEQYAIEYTLKCHIASTIIEGTASRNAIMLCLSLWLHEPYI